MGFLDLKSEILDQDMCTRCGACVAVCPPGLLSISDDHMPVPALDPKRYRARSARCVWRSARERTPQPLPLKFKNLRPEPHSRRSAGPEYSDAASC